MVTVHQRKVKLKSLPGLKVEFLFDSLGLWLIKAVSFFWHCPLSNLQCSSMALLPKHGTTLKLDGGQSPKKEGHLRNFEYKNGLKQNMQIFL